MKLSYDNIEVLAELFQGVVLRKEYCECEGVECEWGCAHTQGWIVGFEIGGVRFKIENAYKNNYAITTRDIHMPLHDQTTIQDFEECCRLAKIKLKRIVHPTPLFD